MMDDYEQMVNNADSALDTVVAAFLSGRMPTDAEMDAYTVSADEADAYLINAAGKIEFADGTVLGPDNE